MILFIGFCRKIQSVFQLSDGSGMAVTVARYETPAHTDIDKVALIFIFSSFVPVFECLVRNL